MDNPKLNRLLSQLEEELNTAENYAIEARARAEDSFAEEQEEEARQLREIINKLKA